MWKNLFARLTYKKKRIPVHKAPAIARPEEAQINAALPSCVDRLFPCFEPMTSMS